MRATRLLWLAAGSPQPYESDGTPIRQRDLSAHPDPRCASCGEPAEYKLSDAISDNFTTVKNAGRAWSFGGSLICRACVWACRSVGLRCGLFFARLADEHGTGGIWFVPIRPLVDCPRTRPDVLDALLNPPPPPFVAGLPLYGIDHGGEANAHRAVWPWSGDAADRNYVHGGLFVPERPLIKLQSKHTALYAQVSYSRDRYYLQVDDTGDVVVDVPLWRALRETCEAILADLRADGVGAMAARAALRTLSPPQRAPLEFTAPGPWRRRVAPLLAHHEALWWELFVNLLNMPDFPAKENP